MASHSVLLTLLLAAVSPAQTITSVALRGTRLPVNLTTQAGESYNALTIEQDMRRLWSTRRFDDIRVETSGTSVIFEVVETPQLALRTPSATLSTSLELPGSRAGFAATGVRCEAPYHQMRYRR